MSMTTKNILALFEPSFGVCAVRPTVDLVPVESFGSAAQWFELRVMKLPLVRITCWSDEGEPQGWRLLWPGPDMYMVTDITFADPVSAARWFYTAHMKEPVT